MEMDAILQIVTVLVAALAIVWHQQHNTDKLREDFDILRGDSNAAHQQHREDFNILRGDSNAAHHQHRQDLNKLREDSNAAHHQHRQDLNKLREDSNAAHHQLREGITENGQRLARIEGFLAIGMPTVADDSIDAGSK